MAKANAKIQLPVKPFAMFIEAASKWLASTTESKKGLELRLAREGDDLHVSVGADSSYIEAVLVADTKELEEPIFLDMSYLSNYPFDVEPLYLVKPASGRASGDKRVQFMASGQNFRIPLRNGDTWERNHQNLDQFNETPGIIFAQDLMNELYANLDLPDSFGQKKKIPERIAFEKLADDKFQVYSEDELGAYWHTFRSDDFQAVHNFTKLMTLHDFLTPFTKIEDFSALVLKQSNRLTMAEVKLNTQGFKKLRWMQPNFVKPMEHIPTGATETRAKQDSCLTFDPAEFGKKVERATVFYRGEKEFQEVPLEFSIIDDTYTISARLSHSEVQIDGKTKNAAPTPMRVNFQAACLRDYLKCMDKNHELNMEIFTQTVILYQQFEHKNLLYWMPVRAR